jgi:outer membrane biosynthesis protein TonB
MKLFEYIQGNRRGKEINRLEKEAMKNLFLADALEGFDKVAGNDHDRRIEAMCAKVLHKTQSGKNHILRYLSIAASILLIIGFGGYFLLNRNQPHTEENVAVTQFDLYVPQRQIIENETMQKSSPSVEKSRLPEMKKQAEKPLIAQTKAKDRKETAPDIEMQKEVIPDTTVLIVEEVTVTMAETANEEPIDRESSKIISFNKRKGKVRGIVTDAEGKPLPGATIMYGGANTGVISDTDGYFELPESNVKHIQINFIGYESMNLVADTDTTMLVAMTEKTYELSEVTVVAFGTQKRETIIGAVSSEKKENLKSQPVIGKKAYEKYLEENIIKPQSEGCRGKKGRVGLKFSINSGGRPINIRVEKSLCPEADEEAIRLINQGSDWSVGDEDVEIDIKF